MLAFSDIIGFLLHLLGDDAARAEFERDPDGTLERAGLDGVTAQDIRDARLQLADSGAVCATDAGAHDTYPDGDDPVREIGYTARHYVAEEHTPHASTVVDHTSTVVTIDDRDTLFFQSISDDDVTVTDNSVSVTDSFNQDNSDDDLVAIQDNDTTVSDDDVTIDASDSFNSTGSFNEDNDLTALQDNSVAIDVTTPFPAGTADPAGVDDAPAEDLAAVSGPAEADDVGFDEDPVVAEIDDPGANNPGDDVGFDDADLADDVAPVG